MKISLNEIKKLVPISVPDDELLHLIGSRLVEVESVDDWTNKFKKIYAVKVLSADPIEGTHLHLCHIDAGAKLNAEVDPSHSDFIQVVCGASNVKAGMHAVWIAPGAIVPATFNTPEPFKISSRKLRGYDSFGMLAAADELSLGSDHTGILSLDPATATPGKLLSELFDLSDKILDIENKSLTHRPDCFGLIGFAREVAGILGQKFTEPAYLSTSSQITSSKELTIHIANPALCPRYSCAVFNFAKLPQDNSPYFTEENLFLIKSGIRPISPIVDLTNRLMLFTGQPLHAFDYDKFLTVGGSKTPNITIRSARDNETLTLLDGKTVTLTSHDIIICSNDNPVALAGAMGGQSTAIDASTAKIILESATFSLYNLRKTQMSHGIFSEAITRFTKGQPASQTLPVLLEASRLLNLKPTILVDSYPSPASPSPIQVKPSFINSLLGSNYSQELIKTTLENVGFSVKLSADETSEKSNDLPLLIAPPVWRTDIHLKEDLAEEIGRLLGYDNLPLSYPLRPFITATLDPILNLKSKIRNVLSNRLGANEVLTYSFVSKALQQKVREPISDSYQIVNSISPELECFRQSITPSLLDKIRENLKAGYADFTLYELNQVTQKSLGLNNEGVPNMSTHLGLTTFGDFYTAKHILLELQKSLGLSLEIRPQDSSTYLEPLHSAAIFLGEAKIGELGEIREPILKTFKLSELISAIELSLEPILSARPKRQVSIKLPKFPYVNRDLTTKVPITTSYKSIESILSSTISNLPNLIFNLQPTSIFSRPNDSTKNLSFHLSFTNSEKTLTSSEISDIMNHITKALQATGATIV